ncbi:MAG: helix-turn-helix domain-containing protein [Chloroflexi bacterium]|nr:helix-turn-helix domain-containing protein [Chloroflexota bacterium]
MNRNYKYRLYPNRVQSAVLDRILDLHQQLYNAALEERRVNSRTCVSMTAILLG